MTTRIGNPVLGFIQTIRIATYTVQADDEEYGGLGGKHCQDYE
jgi:hypothetical protein